MNVLFVVHQFLPRHVAGAELYSYHLAKSLNERGHDVAIYTREFGETARPLKDDDTRYDGLGVKTVFLGSPKGRLRALREVVLDCRDRSVYAHFEDYLRTTKPDVVHVHHLKGLSGSLVNAVRRHNVPLVVTLHDYWFMCSTVTLLTPSMQRCTGPLNGVKCAQCVTPSGHPLIRKGLMPLAAALAVFRTASLRRLLNSADVILAPSEFLRDQFVGHGVSPDKIRFSDYGMKVPPGSERAPGRANGRLRFSFIGSIMPHKGVDVLVDAFSRVSGRDAELRVYGDPGYAPDYYASVVGRARNGSVRFMGKFDNGDVYRILQETDALVVPSVWCENSPLTMHEAVLAGVPVIASNIGGMAELVRRTGNGLLFEVASVDDLHAKIDGLIAERGRLDGLRGRVGEIKRMQEDAEQTEAIYQSLRRPYRR